MYKIIYYNNQGDRIGETTGLSKSEVDKLYKSILFINDYYHNPNKPTVWNEDTGERVAGY